MKITFLLLFLLSGFIYAQDREEKITFEADRGTVYITDTDIWANCASIFQVELSRDGNTFKLVQTDTSVMKEYCMCYFDVDMEINDISPGKYIFELWRQELVKYTYPKDTIYLIAKKELEIMPALQMPPTHLRYLQSDCSDPTGILEMETDSDPFAILSNEGTVTLTFYSGMPGNINLELYDLLSQLIKQQTYNLTRNGENTINFNIDNLNAGLYFARIILPDKAVINYRILKQ